MWNRIVRRVRKASRLGQEVVWADGWVSKDPTHGSPSCDASEEKSLLSSLIVDKVIGIEASWVQPSTISAPAKLAMDG